jgi:uncharacterized protein (DUF1499 family)
MATGRSLTILGLMLLFGIAPLEGGHAADVNGNGVGRLMPCPGSPNCVSSSARGDRHAIHPLVYTGTVAEAREALLGVLEAERRVTLVASDPDYIHAEFRSRIFGFVDDVEFFFPAGQRVIHVRSASRTGYYDFGVNRKRIEGIRRRLEAALTEKGDEK